MGVVDHDRCAISVRHVTDVPQGCDVAIHAEHAVSDDQDAPPGTLRTATGAGVAEHGLEAVDVLVGIHGTPGT